MYFLLLSLHFNALLGLLLPNFILLIMVFERARLQTLWHAHRLRVVGGSSSSVNDKDCLFALHRILIGEQDLDVETLRFIHEANKCPFHPETLPMAVTRMASDEDTAIVQYYLEHVSRNFLERNQRMVKRAAMYCCKFGYEKTLRLVVETVRRRAPMVSPWSPWCLFWCKQGGYGDILNFCVQNGCPEVHLYDNNELYSQGVLGRPIRLGVPYYRKCMRAENRPKNLPYCCELHRTCCTCAGFGHIMKTVRIPRTGGSFQEKSICDACRGLGVFPERDRDGDIFFDAVLAA